MSNIVQNQEPVKLSSAGSPTLAEHDSRAMNKAIRKIDWEILPIMTMFYLLSFLDRSNIGNARVAGLQKDLGMTDQQYQICVTVFFAPYIATELPATLLLRKIGPRILMPSILTLWGVMVTLQAFVTNFAGLVVVRALLGMVEGPMFPAGVLYLSGFYTRRELSLRIAIFFSSAGLSSAFSGLLAAGIEHMHGIGGRPGWSWIFILEGLFSMLVGIASFFIVPSTLRQLKSLSEEEKDLIIRRLENDRPTITPLDGRFSVREILRSLLSPHVFIVFVVLFMIGTLLFGLANFLPSIVAQFGFSRNKTQLLSVGPFAGGFFLTLVTAFWSDRLETRAVPVVITGLITVIGYAMYLGAKTEHVSYGALFLMVAGVNASPPVMFAWMANNSEPYYRRATSLALGFITINLGGILSTWMFPTNQGPKFTRTTIINLVFGCMVVIGSVVNALYLSHMNKKKRRDRAKLLEPYKDTPEEDGGIYAWIELGDKHPDFKYII